MFGYLSANSFKNIVIGTPEKEQTVKCEGAEIFTAGVVGIMNKTKGITIEKCTFYNLSVTAKNAAAGLVAFPTTFTPAKVTDTHLYSPLGSTIESTVDFAGGLIGSSDPRAKESNGSQEFTFENCSIQGYTVSGKKGAGGVIGFRGAWSDDESLILDNIEVNACTIKSDKAAGGLIGEMTEPVNGYNILMKDIVIDETGGNTYKGYIPTKYAELEKLNLKAFCGEYFEPKFWSISSNRAANWSNVLYCPASNNSPL